MNLSSLAQLSQLSVYAGGVGSGRHKGYGALARQASALLKEKGFHHFASGKIRHGSTQFVLKHDDGRKATITSTPWGHPDENTVNIDYFGNPKHETLLDDINKPYGLQAYLEQPNKWDVEAGGPGSGCHGPNCGRPKTASAIIEKRFRDMLQSNPEKYKAAYRRKFKNVLSADSAKELSPEYRADRSKSMSVHEPASELIKEIYAEELKKPASEEKHNVVFFTAGAPGSGKTTGIQIDPGIRAISDHAQLVYDGTMANADSSAKKIDQALAAGKQVAVSFVYREPHEAYSDGILRRAEGSGRVVPAGEAADQHSKVRESIETLRNKYAGDDRVRFYGVDNSNGRGNAKITNFSELPRTRDSKDSLNNDFRKEAQKQYEAGQISTKNYKAAIGYAKGKHS